MKEEKGIVNREQLEKVMYDKTTGIPIFHYYMDRVVEILNKHHALGIIYIGLGNIVAIEEEYGADVYENILVKIGEVMKSLRGEVIRQEDFIALAEIEPDSFIIFLNQNSFTCSHWRKE